MRILRLIKISFDSLENHHPWVEETIASFCDDENDTAYAKAKNHINNISEKVYVGYDLEVYPKYKLIEETAI